MKTFRRLLVLLIVFPFLIKCSKDESERPKPGAPSISALQYSPQIVIFKPTQPTFIITGQFNYQNASEGVARVRLTTSAGGDLTLEIPANTQTSGVIVGSFEIQMPPEPAVYTFQVWIVDNKGSSSNKLSGSIEVVIDDRALNWRIVSQSYGLHRVIWANNKYLTVGVDGTILTSADGENWTAQNSNTTTTLFGVTWSGSQFVAVGDQKTILTSPDGVSWTPRSSGGTVHLYGVASSGTEYLAVGEDIPNNKTVILYSPDGYSWTEDSYSLTGGTLNSIRWTGDQYLAVGGAYSKPIVLTTTNGANWENRSSSITHMGTLADVVYSGSKYVAVGYSVTATSNDGVTWTGNTTNWGAAGVCWSGSNFVASSLVGIMVSADGVNWTKTFDSAYPLRGITWSGVQFVAVGFISPLIIVSP